MNDELGFAESARVELKDVTLNKVITVMTEAEQGDDPVAINKWIEKFSAIPALVWTEAEHARLEEWQQQMKAYNVEAVRREFESTNN